MEVATGLTLSWVPNDGCPLAEIQTGETADYLLPIARKDKRLAVHRPYGMGGAVFALDNWTDNSSNWVRFVWLHQSDLESVVKAAVNVLGLNAKNLEEALSLRLFTTTGIVRHECNASRVLELSKLSSNLGFFELVSGVNVFFADIRPLENQELQMGVIAPIIRRSRPILRRLVKVLSESAYPPFDSEYAEHLLIRLRRFLWRRNRT